jgi:uncharacterized protein YidB (DUF937 family)
MLENLLGTLKSEVGNQILNQTQLPADKLDDVFKVIGDVTKKEVTGQMTSGGIGNLLNLFSNQNNNASANLIQNNIASGVVTNLVSKLGLSQDVAKTISSIAIPAIIGLITKKNSTTPDDDPSPLKEIFGTGKSSAIGGIAKGLLGKLLRK